MTQSGWILVWIGVLTIVVLVYAGWAREYLKRQPWPWTTWYFAKVEPIEMWWKKSESILKARYFMLLGTTLTVLTNIGAVDLSPIKPLLPEKWQRLMDFIPLAITILGMLDERMRNRTTKPVDMVAISDHPSPEVAARIAVADAAKIDAVVAIKLEKGDTDVAVVRDDLEVKMETKS